MTLERTVALGWPGSFQKVKSLLEVGGETLSKFLHVGVGTLGAPTAQNYPSVPDQERSEII